MSDFQGTINTLPAIGVPGQYMATNPLVSHPLGFCAADVVTIGGFVWQATVDSNDRFVKSTGTGVPTGFAVREITNPLAYNVAASNTVPTGFPVSVALKGDFAVVTLTAATAGQKVFAVLADGTIKTGAAGATVADAVETDYVVITAGAVNDTIIISNWAKVAE